MKTRKPKTIVILALLLGLPLLTITPQLPAQDRRPPPERPDRPDRPDRPERPDRPGDRPDRPGDRPDRRGGPMLLIRALDANSDGVIDEQEIANASNALAKLDRNGDGKITRDELRPPRREGDREQPPRERGRGPRSNP